MSKYLLVDKGDGEEEDGEVFRHLVTSRIDGNDSNMDWKRFLLTLGKTGFCTMTELRRRFFLFTERHTTSYS